VTFDLETTGLDVNNDRIVSLAAIKLQPDGSRQSFELLLNPGRPIPLEASAVHGISDDEVRCRQHCAEQDGGPGRPGLPHTLPAACSTSTSTSRP
jgi:DNA polymerase III epsilon subunit-like protein